MADLLTVAEASERLRVSPSMIRKMARQNALTFVRIGRAVRVRAADVDRIVAGGDALPVNAELSPGADRPSLDAVKSSVQRALTQQ